MWKFIIHRLYSYKKYDEFNNCMRHDQPVCMLDRLSSLSKGEEPVKQIEKR